MTTEAVEACATCAEVVALREQLIEANGRAARLKEAFGIVEGANDLLIESTQRAIAERDALKAQAERYRKALKAVQWTPFTRANFIWQCPWCENYQRDGHKPDCPRQLALADAPCPVTIEEVTAEEQRQEAEQINATLPTAGDVLERMRER